MSWTRWLLGAGAGIALGVAALPAQAAPAGALATGGPPASASEGGVVEKAHWERRRYGYSYGYDYYPRRHYYGYGPSYYYGGYYPRRHYSYYPRRYYGNGPAYYYGGYYPRRYYRRGVSVYGPGFGFSFGPRYRYW